MLGITWNGLIAQIVCFGLLLVLLYVFAYKPILRMLDERSRRIKEGQESAEQAKQREEQAEQEFQNRLEQARKEGQSIVGKANEAASRMREEGRQQARQDADTMIERARAEIQRERDQAIDQLRKEFADTAVKAAERVINESLDKERHSKIIDETLEESSSLRKR